MKSPLLVALTLTAGLSVTVADAQTNKATSQTQFAGGTFRRTSPSPATMMIAKRGASWRIALTGAGIPRGANTAADCSLLAEGQLTNDQIQAKLVPFENDNMSIDADDLKQTPGVVVVKLTPTSAVVTEATVDPFCGVGSLLTGTYQKVR